MVDILFWASTLGILGFVTYRAVFRREVRPLLVALGFLGLFVPILVADRIVFPPWFLKASARGDEHQGWVIVLLYLAMLAGMLAHFAYEFLDLPKRSRRKFDLGNFLAPVFVSPIVFLPLASIFESAEPTALKSSRFMLWLVAFENGFFWREFFENRRKPIVAGSAK